MGLVIGVLSFSELIRVHLSIQIFLVVLPKQYVLMKSIKKGGFSRRLSVGVAGARGGLGLLQSKAGSLLLPKDQQKAHNDKALEREASRFVARLGELKGAYVKIGQMLALYGEHVLPGPVTNALHSLESSTKPLDWSAIEPEVTLKAGLAGLSIEKTPLAAASLAQVHKMAVNGIDMPLCIKVQYPGIADAIEDDFKNVMQMLSVARWIKSAKQMEQLANELKHYLLKEVDYTYELYVAQRVQELLSADLRYKIPEYYPEYCSKKLLTMEFVEGHEVTSRRVQALSQDRRNKLAEAMLELFFKEAFEWRLMQTDPNFGNYRVLIDDGGLDRLVLLDFGAVHELPYTFTEPLRSTILCSQVGDEAGIVAGLIKLNCLREADSVIVKESFAGFCKYIMEPFYNSYENVPEFALDGDDYDWKNSRLLKRAGRMGSQGMMVKGFTVPPSEFMLMVRKLTGVFTFVSALGAKTQSAFILNKYRVG